uniref:Uncharacterized protein n=1 Tax=Sphaerodactylus townsendi TaxID=933632 RepID=A0ACB8EAC9_9SAUR
MSACKHLSTSLMQLLLEAEVRQLSLGALRQFNLDVEECEPITCHYYVKCRHVSGLQSPSQEFGEKCCFWKSNEVNGAAGGFLFSSEESFCPNIVGGSEFARSGPVPGFQGDTLQLAFIDLRQFSFGGMLTGYAVGFVLLNSPRQLWVKVLEVLVSENQCDGIPEKAVVVQWGILPT